mgnify:CR=1 FL=1
MSDGTHKEAVVAINGSVLTLAQSMVLRCAVSHMLMDMQDPLALGNDDHGRYMVQAYKARLRELEELIFRNLV